MITNVLIPFLVSGLIIYLIIYLAVNLPGRALRHKFEELGEIKGMSKAEIVSRCGKYHSKRPISKGSVCVWMVPGFVISVVFDLDDKAVKACTKSSSKAKSDQLSPVLSE